MPYRSAVERENKSRNSTVTGIAFLFAFGGCGIDGPPPSQKAVPGSVTRLKTVECPQSLS